MKDILTQYALGEVKAVDRIASGLIHETYKVSAQAGDFILQKLHPMLSDNGVGEDMAAVTSRLKEQGFFAPELVKTMSGNVHAEGGGSAWRLQTFIEGTTFDAVEDPELLREAGTIFARFHKALDGMDYAFKNPLKLHETKKEYQAFLDAIEGQDLSDVKGEVEFIKSELPKLMLPDDLPQRVIHGDPKISNILFKDGKAVTIVDLDTCNRHTILVELGDALRSWCGLAEDDPNNPFRLEVFKAAWEGYSAEAAFLTAKERSLVPQAIGTITLELASRFLADYFNDAYFGWDASRYPSRKAHNLARVRGQIHLYRDLLRQMEEVTACI